MEIAGNKALFRRFANVALLIGGFGLGQGSIFIAQTYLVASARLELLAQFGLHFSFAMLAIIIVEAGSLTILARHASVRITEGRSSESIWEMFWETSAFRLTMALLVVAGVLAYLLSGQAEAFSRNYAIFALPAVVIWAFNAAGFLDGLQKSGISGVSGSIAYMASAVALFFARDMDFASAGRLLGSALTLGYVVTVIVQHASLAASGWKLRFVRPTRQGLQQAFGEELSMLAGLVPGQIYFRLQLMLSEVFLGSAATALLVYAKQIVAAASQMTGFIRRVEFPGLLNHMIANPAATTRSLLLQQKLGLGFAGLMTVAILLASLVVITQFGGFTRQAWLMLSLFCFTILTESIGQSLVQILFAKGHYAVTAMIRILAVSIGLGFGYLAVSQLGLNVFAFADFCSHATVILLSVLYLSRKVGSA